ncbi:disease resistance protein RPM1 [Triticum aestivum]|uniref:disease resistance protein RPM1 n=1 Tax=Triticum aestivum TaxID=4565 RepID=UPI001D031E3A|nr:disease resistance protein RPM1-like [Triticum aestivum]
MAEIVILLAIKKIGIALAKGATDQASVQLMKYGTQLLELQGSMSRVARKLRLIHDVLCQMDIRNRNNQIYEGWLEDVRKVAHVMEGMVDEYLYVVLGNEHDIGCSFFPKKVFQKPISLLSLNRIAFKVKEIEKDLSHLSEAKIRLVPMINIRDTSNLNYIVKRSHDLANISRSLYEEDLVGIDKNREKLEQWLASDDMECSVIAFLGMAMDITSLEETLRKFLEKNKYLIILDDVWTTEAFDDLSRMLIHNDKGSRLIITTREGHVAALASRGHILALEVLAEDKAWDLFCKKSFPGEANHDCPTKLKSLSKEIVIKCKGLPLVVVLVGGLLRVHEKTVEEWRRINVQLSWEIINNLRLDHVRNVLHLSFIYLPTHLKSCFMYCSLFPEDYFFKRKQIIRLWIAEGFIEERGESTLEEVAEGYLKELIDRNMLQLVVGRRLVLPYIKYDIQQSFSSLHQLRTIITLGNSKSSFTLLPLLCMESRYMTVLELSGLPIEKIPDVIGDLFNLHHLGLRNSKVKMLPKSIEKLSNLLTLDLCKSDIHELPSGIVKLKKLRHLFVEKINDPDWRNINHLSGMCIPNGVGNLTNLQTLQALEAQDESLRHLGELRQLRSLRLLNVKGIYCGRICESLVHMRHLSLLSVNASDENEVLLLNVFLPSLQKLRLRGRLAQGALDESPIFQVVGGQNLYELVLSFSQLREDPLPSLSWLSNLTRLHFTRAYTGEHLKFLTGWFPKLKVLSLTDLPNLKYLEIQEGAMGCLENLFLIKLTSMTEVPLGIEFLMPLEYLGFHEITGEFLTLLRHCSAIRGTRLRYSLRD